MRIHPLSFLFGVGVVAVFPAISRFLRPLAVEAAAAGMAMLEDGRRVWAEKMELLEDVAAEARARREQLVRDESAPTGNGSAPLGEGAPTPRRRRRNGAPADDPHVA